jgi:hypothetical protein
MTVQKKWSIEGLKSFKEDGLVIEAEWRVSSSGEVKPYFLFGSCKFERGDSFTPFEDLTESQVVEWVKEQLGSETVAELENAIDDELSEKNVTNSIPWVPKLPE